MPRIVISESMDAPAVALLARDFDVDYRPALFEDAAALAAALAPAEAWIVRNRTQVRGEPLAAAARLKVVGRLGVGLDNIDLEACAARAIEVIPATGANAESVAEYVLAMAMILLRGAAYLSTLGGAGGSLAAADALAGPRGGRQDPRARGLRQHRPRDGAQGGRHGHAGRRLRSRGGGRLAFLGRARRRSARPGRASRALRRRLAAPARSRTRRGGCWARRAWRA